MQPTTTPTAAPTRDAIRIKRQLETAFSGPSWHGPSLMENLTGVSAKVAAAKPIHSETNDGVHSIWEIVNHLLAWHNEVSAGLEGKPYMTLSSDADWPLVIDQSPAAWDATLRNLAASHARLCGKIEGLSDDRLRAKVDGKEWDLRVVLRGIASHTLYHAGQIGLLKKLAQ